MIHGKPMPSLPELFELDETAWLEQMAALAGQGAGDALDLHHLSEYLGDMAKRDKREVVQRMMVLLVHLLKWEHQPKKRTRSWQLTIDEQREELQELLESGSLRGHAEQDLSKIYSKAVRRAAVETKLKAEVFADECPYTLEQILGD